MPLNTPAILVPTAAAAVMITTEISAAIRPYSMAVTPDSSPTKRERRNFIEPIPCWYIGRLQKAFVKTPFALGSSCQLSGDTSEHTGEAGADGGSRGDDHDRDKRGDQTIFNGGDARLVSKETGE